MAEQGELLPERQVLKREIGAGSERSTRVSQESEYEGHCAQRRSASSRRPVSRSSLANDNRRWCGTDARPARRSNSAVGARR